MTALALAFVAGAGLELAGAPFEAAPLVLLALLLPIQPWTRPSDRLPVVAGFVVVALAGWTHSRAVQTAREGDCRWSLPSDSLVVDAVIEEVDGPGRLRVRAEPVPGCTVILRVATHRRAELPAPGSRVHLSGVWSATGQPDRRDPLHAGILLAGEPEATRAEATPPPGGTPRRLAAVLRGRAAAALIDRLPAEGGLATALVVARRDGVPDEVREAFVRSGTAHLLAISGFHVGVVALLAAALARGLGSSRRAASATAALVAGGYAAILGFPDAATRAALLVTLVTLGRALGRPTLSVGALSTALLLLVLVDPPALGRIGFQLSFGGAFGLAILSTPLARRLGAAVEPLLARVHGTLRARLEGPVTSLLDAVAASAAATLVTLPLVGWHFEAISLVGIPATLVAGPLVAAALPGLLLVVVLEGLGLPGAALPAAGAEALLAATRLTASAWAALPGAVLPAARGDVLAGGAGILLAGLLLSRSWGIGVTVRTLVVAAGCATGLVLRPVSDGWVRNGTVELHVLDVGQGDAIAVRTPRGRWVLVDTGPDPGDRLVRDLRGRGVRDIALLVLTHPDLDHLGGAAETIEAFPVGAVADPGTVRGTAAYREVLEAALAGGAPWRVVSRGDRLDLDGVGLRVLHPERLEADDRAEIDPNDRSVVLLLEWNGFRALLTGDAPVADEERFGPLAGPVDVLKVGHHGSRTSTGQALLDAVRPSVALVSLGRYNRFGHPDPAVVARLEAAGIPLFRTDQGGAVTVRVEESGAWAVRAERPGAN